MTKAFDKIMAGAEDALAYAEGDKNGRVVHSIEVVDAKAVRLKTKLSQPKFAKVFCIPLSTLQNWEQGIRKPQGPALALLTIINNDPKAAIEALHK